MISTWFPIFCLAWFSHIAAVLHRFLPRRAATLTLGAFALWLIYACTLAVKGLLVSPQLPPRLLLLLVPLVVFIFWMSRSRTPLLLANNTPLRLLVALQSFRIGVEFFLAGLWRIGLLPKGMTYHGHNFDILTGISAALLCIFWRQIPKRDTVIRVWNYAGLALVAQVAVTGILSAPGPQQIMNQETPNVAVVSFPYVLVPALFVVSAVALHILALRKLAQTGS